jgi:DNA transformation protein
MPQGNSYLEFILEGLAPLGEITTRKMFGGLCLYCDGIVFALMDGSTLYLKVDDVTRPLFEKRKLKPFQPFPDQPGTMSYYPPPAEFFDDRDEMLRWGKMGLDAGLRAAAKKRKAKPAARKSAPRRKLPR